MLKPFSIRKIPINQQLIDEANKLGLSESCVRYRIERAGWPPEKACTTPQITRRKDPAKIVRQLKTRHQAKIRTYHLPLEEIWAKYGKPGELMHSSEATTWQR